MPDKFLVVGLGNVGARYAFTRHNVGFEVVDALASRYGVSWSSARYANAAFFRLRGRMVYLIKPTTYMNRSGKAARYWCEVLKVSCENFLVLLDDVSLPLCRIRLRPKGGSAGHNGLEDIIQTMSTDRFPRLRIGIGNNYPWGKQVEYVLGHWSDAELGKLRMVLNAAADAVETFILEGLSAAMNRFNGGWWCETEDR